MPQDPDTSIRHPDTSYNSQYPYNQSELTQAGHSFEVDNTPNNERLRYAHKTGTYWEINPDGRKVEMTTSDHTHYVKGGYSFTSDKNSDMKFGGHWRMTTGRDVHMEVGSNCAIVCGTDCTIMTKGSVSVVSAKNATIIAGGNLSAKCNGNANVVTGGNCSVQVGGTLQAQVKGDIKMQSNGQILLKADKIVLDSQDVELGGEGGKKVLTIAGPAKYVQAV